MDLIIKEEKYKIKVGADIYSVEYPSFEQAQEIAKQFGDIEGDGEKSIKLMRNWLKELGLDDKFFALKVIKSKHILTIWKELNGVKK